MNRSAYFNRSGRALGGYLAIIIVLLGLGWWVASRSSSGPGEGAPAEHPSRLASADRSASPQGGSDFDPKAAGGNANQAEGGGPDHPVDPAGAGEAQVAKGPAGGAAPAAGPGAGAKPAGGADPFRIPGTAAPQRPGEELLASEAPPRRARITPSWQTGEHWLVESYYANIAAPQPQAVWRGPVTWRFDVQQRVQAQDHDEFVVAVEEVERDGSPLAPGLDDDGEALDEALPAAIFHVDARTHRLIKTLIPRREQGEVRMVETDLSQEQDGASGARYTLIPFDLPDFSSEAVVIEAAEGPDLDVYFDRGPRQLEAGDVMPLGPDYLKIEFARAQDQTPVTQRWAARDMRWPVLSYTRTTRSYRRKDL